MILLYKQLAAIARMSQAQQQQPQSTQHPLQQILTKRTKVISNDGRVFVGILQGLDQAMNCILSECFQYVYSEDQDIRKQKIGIYFIRGDSIVVIGEYLSEEDEDLTVRAAPLGKCQ